MAIRHGIALILTMCHARVSRLLGLRLAGLKKSEFLSGIQAMDSHQKHVGMTQFNGIIHRSMI